MGQAWGPTQRYGYTYTDGAVLSCLSISGGYDRGLSNVDGAVTGGYTGGYIPGVVGHPAYYNMQGGLQPQLVRVVVVLVILHVE